MSAHRERRRRLAEADGQRAEETGGQPVTFGITRASELVGALEKLTTQRADTLAREITELRAVGDIVSAEAEVYAARTSADQRVATAEARLPRRSSAAGTPRPSATPHAPTASRPTTPPPRPSTAWTT